MNKFTKARKTFVLMLIVTVLGQITGFCYADSTIITDATSINLNKYIPEGSSIKYSTDEKSSGWLQTQSGGYFYQDLLANPGITRNAYGSISDTVTGNALRIISCAGKSNNSWIYYDSGTKTGNQHRFNINDLNSIPKYTVEYTINWAMINNNEVGQIGIGLTDANNKLVVYGGFADGSSVDKGYIQTQSDIYAHGINKNMSGSAVLCIVRNNTKYDVYVDGVLYVTSTTNTVLNNMVIYGGTVEGYTYINNASVSDIKFYGVNAITGNYRFDDNSNPGYDSSECKNHGTASNAVIGDGAAVFGGSSSYQIPMDTVNNSALSADFSVNRDYNGAIFGSEANGGMGSGTLSMNSSAKTITYAYTPTSPQIDSVITFPYNTSADVNRVIFSIDYSTGRYHCYLNGEKLTGAVSRSVTNYIPMRTPYDLGRVHIGKRMINGVSSYAIGKMYELTLMKNFIEANHMNAQLVPEHERFKGVYTFENLGSNTEYLVKEELKNSAGAIITTSYKAITKAATPSNAVMSTSGKDIILTVEDANPINTEYNAVVTYTGPAGTRINTGRWGVLPDKKLHITGILPGDSVDVSIKARNKENIETPPLILTSIQSQAEMMGDIENLRGDRTSDSIHLIWNAVDKATAYEIEQNGSVIPLNPALKTPSYKITGVKADTLYRYRIRSINLQGASAWSRPLDIRTLKSTPGPVGAVTSVSANKWVELAWHQAENAWDYEVEFDGQLLPPTKGLKTKVGALDQNTAHAARVRGVNADGAGPWSDITYIWTTNRPPDSIENLTEQSDERMISLKWDTVEDAEDYTVTITEKQDGEVTNTWDRTVTIPLVEVMSQGVGYTYSVAVKASNRAGESTAAIKSDLTAFDLPTPAIKWLDADYEDVIVQWDKISGADSYELEADGTVVGSTSLDRYTFKFDSSLKHIYRLRALSGTGTSNWSEPFESQRIPARPDWVSNLVSFVDTDRVELKWRAPEPRTQEDTDTIIGYDVEVDGYIVQTDDPRYLHEGLAMGSKHFYRVRAITGSRAGFWTDYYQVKTPMGMLPQIYKIRMASSRHTNTMTWDPVEGATWYEVEVDGQVIKGYSDEWFEQHGVSEFTEHSYRVRACNKYVKGPWSRLVINNSIQAKVEKDKELDLGLTATDVTDFKKYRLEVYYPSVLKVEDLCAYTGKKELSTGMIEGIPIEIVDHSPGRIELLVHKHIDEGTSWTGIINNILFKGRQTGGTTITYTVHDIEGENEPGKEHDLKLLEEENYRKANPYALESENE